MIFRFENFELNEITREIQKAGALVSTEPKVFDLLCLLIRHRNRVLPRDLLLNEIWPGIVVSEASLGRLIKEARRAIGDSGNRQDVIRTLRGSGYRFVANVAVEGESIDGAETDAGLLLSHARLTLEAAVDRGSRDMRGHIEEFVRTCQIAIASVRREAE